jgi:uncharacterized protein (TIGR00661 family)
VGQKTILFGVLNWGLGHASRSIPIIHNLISNPEVKVIIAADGEAYNLLSLEFPALQIVRVEDVHVQYKSDKWLPFGLLITGIMLLKINRKEHKQVSELVNKYDVDLIISDNRYGFWDQSRKNIIITHQLTLLPPRSFAFMEFLFRRIIKQRLAPFDEVWVPDLKQEPGIAGVLSHQPKAHPKIRYIGLWSRYCKEPVQSPIPLVAIVSGPMPFRKQLAEKLIQIAETNSTPLVLFTNDLQLKEQVEFVEVRQNASFQDLNSALNRAEMVVASAGYTTIMDLILLDKKAILIPTPGQTEQAYLAKTNRNKLPIDFLPFDELNQLFDRIAQLKRETRGENHQSYNNHKITSFADFIDDGL